VFLGDISPRSNQKKITVRHRLSVGYEFADNPRSTSENQRGVGEEIKCRIGIGAAWEVGRGYGFHIKGQGRESGTGDREGVRVKRTESQGNGNRTARGKKLLPERGKPQPPHRLEGGGEIGRVGGDDATDGYRGRRMVAKQKRKKNRGQWVAKLSVLGRGHATGRQGRRWVIPQRWLKIRHHTGLQDGGPRTAGEDTSASRWGNTTGKEGGSGLGMKERQGNRTSRGGSCPDADRRETEGRNGWGGVGGVTAAEKRRK